MHKSGLFSLSFLFLAFCKSLFSLYLCILFPGSLFTEQTNSTVTDAAVSLNTSAAASRTPTSSSSTTISSTNSTTRRPAATTSKRPVKSMFHFFSRSHAASSGQIHAAVSIMGTVWLISDPRGSSYDKLTITSCIFSYSPKCWRYSTKLLCEKQITFP